MTMHQVLKVALRTCSSNIIVTNPYDKKDSKQASYSSSQSAQSWRQFHTRADDAVVGVEVATHLISPRHPTLNNSVNDNYWKIDPPVANF